MILKDTNKKINDKIIGLKYKLKAYGELETLQEDAIILFKNAKNQKERDQYNKYYFHTVTKIDKLKLSISITKAELGILESERELKLKRLS
jgi:hypothetical protein